MVDRSRPAAVALASHITPACTTVALALSATWVPSRTSTCAVAEKLSASFFFEKVFIRRLPAPST